MNNLIEKFLFSFLILLAGLILGIGFLFSYHQIERLQKANAIVVHTHHVIEKLSEIQGMIALANTYKNNFIVIQEPSLKEHYGTQMIKVSYNLLNVKEFTKDNPAQQKNLLTFSETLNEKIKNDNLLMSRSETGVNTKLIIGDNKNSILRDKINNLLDASKNIERELLEKRNIALNQSNEMADYTIIITGIAGFGLLLLSYLIISYQLKRRNIAENQRHKAETQLKKIIDSSTDLIAAIDLDYRYIGLNPAYQLMINELYNIKPEMNMSLHETFYSADEKEKIIHAWQKALEGKEHTEIFNYPSHFNEDKFYEALFSPIFDNDDRAIGALQIMRDITARKKVEMLKSEFVSTVSHELRTPLTSIRGSIGIILGGAVGEVNDNLKNMLMIAYNNCERLVGLINDILDVEKIESGKIDFQLTNIDLNKLIKDAIIANRPYADKFGITLASQLIEKNIYVRGDYNRLMQVLTNLISNAVKFSFAKGEVLISTSTEYQRVRVMVTDFGEGVPKDFRKHIFAKFSQADSSAIRKQGGSGLGLSIAKAIIEKLNGSIDYVCNKKTGTTFYFELPILETIESMDNSMASTSNKNALKILHIEDDADLSRIIATVLRDEADIVCVDSKENALKLLDEKKFDLVLLDLRLPDGSGTELLPEFKKRNLPVIVFTAYDLPQKFQNYVLRALVKSKTTNAELVKAVQDAIRELKLKVE